jgi:hypothetical protein
MNSNPPTIIPKPGLGPMLPPGQTQTSFNSAYVRVGFFVFNPTLVMGFLHRAATEESVPSTEVLYESHHISVEDPSQALFFYLCSHARPQEVPHL